MNKRKIYTHSPRSHVDELTACAILCMRFNIYKIVQVSSIEEVKITDVDFVVDIGNKYDGEQYFDHHQDDPLVEDKCAATLVAERYAPELLVDKDWKRFFERIDIQDNHGFQVLQERTGVQRDKIPALLAYERGLISLFEKKPLLAACIVSDMLKESMDNSRLEKEADEWLNDPTNVEILSVNGAKVMALLKNPGEEGYAHKHIISAQSKYLNEYEISFVYGFDERQGHRSLFRTHTGTKLGHSLVKSNPNNLKFKHKNGFFLVFDASSDGEYIKLINEATI